MKHFQLFSRQRLFGTTACDITLNLLLPRLQDARFSILRTVSSAVALVLVLLMISTPIHAQVVTAGQTFTGFTPRTGDIGDSVILTGRGFEAVTAVRFNGVEAAFTVDSDTQITATVPLGATTGPLSVVFPQRTLSIRPDFTVTNNGTAVATPTTNPTSNPTAGPTTNPTVNPTTNPTIVPTANPTAEPTPATTPVPVVAPTINGFTPNQAGVGGVVTITGANFTGTTSVIFNEAEAAFTVDSATQITAIVPDDATNGPIRITNAGGTAVSTNNFFVAVPTPTPLGDRIAPTVSFTSPSLGAGFSGISQFPEIRGSVADNLNGSGVNRVELTLRRQSDGKYWNGTDWIDAIPQALPTPVPTRAPFPTPTATPVPTPTAGPTPNGTLAPAPVLSTTLNGDGTFSRSTGLPSGNDLTYDVYTIVATAFDNAGNRRLVTNEVKIEPINSGPTPTPTVGSTPTPQATTQTTGQPTSQPTANATSQATTQPTANATQPTANATSQATAQPTVQPTVEPTLPPQSTPTPLPTATSTPMSPPPPGAITTPVPTPTPLAPVYEASSAYMISVPFTDGREATATTTPNRAFNVPMIANGRENYRLYGFDALTQQYGFLDGESIIERGKGYFLAPLEPGIRLKSPSQDSSRRAMSEGTFTVTLRRDPSRDVRDPENGYNLIGFPFDPNRYRSIDWEESTVSTPDGRTYDNLSEAVAAGVLERTLKSMYHDSPSYFSTTVMRPFKGYWARTFVDGVTVTLKGRIEKPIDEDPEKPVPTPTATSIPLPVGTPTPIGTSTPSATPVPTGLGKIAYTQYGNIGVMNADGTRRTQLTTGTGLRDEHPGLSRDGSMIAFDSLRSGGSEIWIMKADGSELKRLTNTGGNTNPEFSPDGTKILWTHNDSLNIMNIDGSNVQVLAQQGEDGFWSGDGSKIVFASARDGNREIYIMNADGSNQTRITNDPGRDDDPAWSPDGTKIVWMRESTQGGAALWLMNADGTDQHMIPDTTIDLPVFSPDSKRITISGAVATINLDGGNKTFLKDETGQFVGGGHLSWSLGTVTGANPSPTTGSTPAPGVTPGITPGATPAPAGIGKIAYTHDANIWIMNADGSSKTKLTTGTQQHDEHPGLSRDGTKIVFDSFRDGNSEIYIMNADGSNIQRLTNNTADDRNPEISPDGTKIVWHVGGEQGGDIFVMNLDGSSPRQLTGVGATQGQNGNPFWSGDGTRIVFDSNRDGNNEIYTMNADGSNPLRLTNNSVRDDDPSWSPDNSKIVFVREGALMTMRADGTFQQPIADVRGDLAVFSPDNTKIAYSGGNGDLFTANVDGTSQTNLTNINGDGPASGHASWSVGSVTAPSSGDLIVAQNRATTATIVVAANGGTWEKQAATDLQKYIELMSGAKPPIANAIPAGDAPLLIVGSAALAAEPTLTSALDGVVKKNPTIRADAVVVRRSKNRIYLAGTNDESHYFAATWLLQKWGCRWYLPTEIGEVVPEVAEIKVGDLNFVYAPPFEIRHYWISWNGSQQGATEFRRRNFMAETSMVGMGHNLGTYTADLAPPGGSSFNVPFSEARTAEHVAAKIEADYAAGRDISLAIEDGNYTNNSLSDQKLIVEFDKYMLKPSLTDAMMTLYNNVGRILRQKYPNSKAKIGGMAYANVTMPPKIVNAVEPNVVMWIAPIDIDPIHGMDDPKSPPREEYQQMMERWADLLDGRLAIYDYDQGMLVWRDMPNPSHTAFAQDVKHYQDAGILGIGTESRNAIATVFTNLYFRGQLMWNPDADVDDMLTEFYRGFYGPAAEPMADYWKAIYDAWDNSIVTEHEYFVAPAIYTPQLILKLGTDLLSAQNRVASLRNKPNPTRNERLYVQRIDFAQKSFDVIENYMAMVRASASEVDYQAAVELANQGLAARNALTQMNPTFTSVELEGDSAAWWKGEPAFMRELLGYTNGTRGTLIAKTPLEWSFKRGDPLPEGWNYTGMQGANPLTDTTPATEDAAQANGWSNIRTDMYLQSQGILNPDGQSYTGHYWYQTSMELTADQATGNIHIMFPGLFNEAWLYVNGQQVAHRDYNEPWWLTDYKFTWDVDLTGRFNAGRNVITVCGFNPHHFGGMFRRPFLYRPNN